MSKLIPFADDATSLTIGGLTVENGEDQVSLYGSLDITRDKKGLANARALKAILDQAVQQMELDGKLPDALPTAVPTKKVANPFS